MYKRGKNIYDACIVAYVQVQTMGVYNVELKET